MSAAEGKKGDLAIRDKAVLHQQRRLKQNTQFTHKDSADFLPLDGLKRLGGTRDLQPHSIVQRRLLEGNITRLRGAELRDPNDGSVRSPLVADNKDGNDGGEERSESTADDSTEERESPEESERSLRSDEEEEEEEDGSETGGGARQTAERSEGTGRSLTHLTALLVQCKCCDTEVKASIDTGSQHNHISSACCGRLGLVPRQDGAPGLPNMVRGLQLQLGRQSVQCSAHVTEDEAFDLCLGLHTLLELKCCVDLSSRVLKLQGEELPFLKPPSDCQCCHDTNENL